MWALLAGGHGDTNRNGGHRRRYWRRGSGHHPDRGGHAGAHAHRSDRAAGWRLVARARKAIDRRVRTPRTEARHEGGRRPFRLVECRRADVAGGYGAFAPRVAGLESGWSWDAAVPFAAYPGATAASYAVALWYALAGLGAWIRRAAGVEPQPTDTTDIERIRQQLHESQRLIQESRNELRRGTGNALEPLAFPRRHRRRRGNG